MAKTRLVERTTDVLVVGGGPAGSTAAGALSRRGLAVILIDAAPPSANNHDVTISAADFDLDRAPAVRARRLDGWELSFGDRRRRRLPDPALYAVTHRALRDTLTADAVAGGVTRIEGSADERMVVVPAAGEEFLVHARHVVIAAAGFAPFPVAGTVVSRRMRGVDIGPHAALHFSTPAATEPGGRMACTRIVPGPDGTGTVTVTALNPAPAAELFATTFAEIVALDPRLGAAEPIEPLVCAPINAAFSPRTCVRNGRLLVGAAAGLTNPFTGEGISYAVQSALIAADCIAEHATDPAEAAAAYRRRVGAAFVGYFETARHAVRRYHLAWRALGATLHTDGAFFAKARRALILPEGLERLSGRQRIRMPATDSLLVKTFLASCDEIVIGTVRAEWPFLARLFTTSEGERLRPALLLLAGTLCGGGPPPARAAPIGAAIELTALAMLAFIGAPAAPRQRARGVDWACATRVLAGDFLIAAAAKLVADAGGSRFSYPFAEWLGELTALRSQRLDPATPTAAADLFGSLFEFPCRIGAELGGAAPDVGKALREHGYECGRAFLFAEDLIALRGSPGRLDTDLAGLLTDRVSALPDLLKDPDLAADAFDDQDFRARAEEALEAAMGRAHQRAIEHLAGLPPRPAHILRAFAAAVAATDAHQKGFV
jgi:flavin-dependent dehydrogenase/geranylgeranyl pyrophosphate synthase